jgi:Calcineurin-like phosphoesterase
VARFPGVFRRLTGAVVLVASAIVPVAPAGAATPPVLVAAGDIACAPGSTITATTCNQTRTAALIATLQPRYVAALGDLVYPAGSSAGFTDSYGPSWGRFKSITKPVPGNHEYGSPGASGYYGYFGSRATPLQPTCARDCKGYYSYSTGSWHVVALNTRCSESAGSCSDMTAQAAWLDADLSAHPNTCTLAYMHHPLFSGGFGATSGVKPLWNVLQKHGVDLVLAGHAHNYQRFVSQTPGGTATARGITELIVGTGGVNLQTLTTVTNQAAHINHLFGVVKLTLNPGGWASKFVATTGASLDPATGTCH